MKSVIELKNIADAKFKELEKATREVERLKKEVEEEKKKESFFNVNKYESLLAVARSKQSWARREYNDALREAFGPWTPRGKDCTK